MKLTLIKSTDNTLTIDGVGYAIDTSSVPENVHAIQWFGQTGWIEFVMDPTTGIKPPNETITSISEYQELIDLWEEQKTQHEQYLTSIEYTPAMQNKAMARGILRKTDWVENSSVTDPAIKPTLTNKAEFDAYRAAVRAIAVDPPEELYQFPAVPSAVWEK